MKENLNKIEIAILKAIIDVNKIKYPFLQEHFNYLYIKKREYTGVGIYVDFDYTKDIIKDINVNTSISSEKSLIIKGLQNEVTYELDISEGKIIFLELVTNGDDCLDENTDIGNFELID